MVYTPDALGAFSRTASNVYMYVSTCWFAISYILAFPAERLDEAPAADQSDDEQDDRYDQQDMDERADGVAAHQAEQPQDQENDSDGVQHVSVSFSRFLQRMSHRSSPIFQAIA
jgi:hypothetical protein